GQACVDTISDFSLRATPHADQTGVWVGNRLLAVFGVTIRDWVSGFGAYLNIQPVLGAYRSVQTLPGRRNAMTSLECERRGPVRTSMVRQRLVEHFQARFGFADVALFTDHPAIRSETRRLHEQAVGQSSSARCG